MAIHPEGKFAAIIEDHCISEGKNSDAVEVKFKTSEGYIRGFFYLSEKAIDYTAAKLKKMGFMGKSFAELNEQPPMLAGHEVFITVKHEEYNNKVNAKVAGVYGPDDDDLRGSKEAAERAKRYDSKLLPDSEKPVVQDEEPPF